MTGETGETVTTVVGGLSDISDSPPALVFIGYGIACIAAGQWMLEVGIKRAGGIAGVRRALVRAERMVSGLEARESQLELLPSDH